MEQYLYEDLYQLEDKHWWHIAKREICLRFLGKYLTVKRPKILDIGCGTGKNIETFNAIGPTSGIDISSDAIAYCQKRGLRSTTLGNAEETGFDSKVFSVITLFDVLEHADENLVIKEIDRILKPRGLLVLTVPALPQLWSKWDVVLHHKRRYTRKHLMVVLKRHGFHILELSYLFSFLVVPAYIIRLIKSKLYKNTYPSDFRLSSPFINTLLLSFARLEAFLLNYIPVPIGTTLVVVAQKT